MKKISFLFTIAALFASTALSVGQSMSKKYQSVKVSIPIDAPAARTWKALVLDYGEISNFSPYIYSSNYENGSLKGVVGAERKCNFNEAGTQWVHERIEKIDEENMVMLNHPIGGEKLPLNFDNSRAFYRVTDNGDGTSTASYEFQFRTKPAIMGAIAKGNFEKQLAGTLIGLKHYLETGEKVTPMNKKYETVKENYFDQVITE